MNERRIVEEGLLVTMLIRLVREGAGEVFSGCSLEAGGSLQIAAREILMQASPTARGKIARRIGNIGDRCVATNVPAATHPTLFGLAVYAILKHLGDEDYLTVGGASRLADAVDLILAALEPAAAVEGHLERSQSMASDIFNAVQADGLFRDVRSMA
jgi:hypothetical protein